MSIGRPEFIILTISFLAGFVARKMGFPIRLIAVVNPNDIVHRAFNSGDLSIAKEVKATWASAMDIQVRMIIELRVLTVIFSETIVSNSRVEPGVSKLFGKRQKVY